MGAVGSSLSSKRSAPPVEEAECVTGRRRRKRLKQPPRRKMTKIIPAAGDSSDAEDDQALVDEEIPAYFRKIEEVFPAMKEEYDEYKARKKNALCNNNSWHRDIRELNGGRYQIKVMGDYMLKLEGFGVEFATKLVAYAERQARKDPYVTRMDPKFSEWSLIVSKGECLAQINHADVREGYAQFGLVLMDNIPGTIVVAEPDFGPRTLEGLLARAEWADAPKRLQRALEANKETVVKILGSYGDLLLPRAELEAGMVGSETLVEGGGGILKCGDLVSMAGQVVHKGPPYVPPPGASPFRVVMFAASSPSGEDLHNVDDAFFPFSAVLFLMEVVWDQIWGTRRDPDGDGSQAWLLHKLAAVVREYDDFEAQLGNVEHISPTIYEHFLEEVKASSCPAADLDGVVSNFLVKHRSTMANDLFQKRGK